MKIPEYSQAIQLLIYSRYTQERFDFNKVYTTNECIFTLNYTLVMSCKRNAFVNNWMHNDTSRKRNEQGTFTSVFHRGCQQNCEF